MNNLSAYHKKRNFDATPEPEGKVAKKAKAPAFVVQRHHASHLHYDFRLELGGTLKSWAVPKGPSLNPADKRLAMMVEDHPLDYASFEGTIPEGNYGAGQVTIWDAGTYEPLDDDGQPVTEKQLRSMLRKGSIKFRMKGKKLKGEFALVKMKADENAWLLIKHRDKYAVDEEYNSEDHASKSALRYTQQRKQAVKKKPVEKIIRHIPLCACALWQLYQADVGHIIRQPL